RVNLSLDIGAVGLSSFAEEAFGVTGLIYEAPGDDTTRVTQEVRIASPLGHRVEWRAGGFFTHENSTFAAIMNAEDPITGRIAGRYFESNSGYRFDGAAVFGDLTYHLTPRFDIQFGGRESHDRVVNPASITTGGYAAVFLGGDPAITPRYESTGNVFTY